MKKLLILGGSGYVGSSFVNNGINQNLTKHKINEIFIVSRKNKVIKKKYKHIKINYISKNILNIKKLPQVDYVIYCLKHHNIRISENYFNHFNKLILKLSKKPKILFTSSGAVYGYNNKKIKNNENNEINLKLIRKLKGYKKKYAMEKIFIEKKFNDLTLQKYNVSIARCYTFIGKEIIKYKYAVADLINLTLKKKIIKLKTSTNIYRSYMHSDDLVNWLIVILKNSNKECPIYNVGSDKVINLKNLAKLFARLFNNKISLKKITSKSYDYYVPSIARARKKLNLKISINLKDAINSTIKSLND